MALAIAHLDPCSETQEHMGRVDTGRDGENQFWLDVSRNAESSLLFFFRFADAKLFLFGSSKNGFGFRNSDMDICMTLGNRTKEEVNYFILLVVAFIQLTRNSTQPPLDFLDSLLEVVLGRQQ